MNLRPFLTFKGNCAEAIEHYKKAFNIECDRVLNYGSIPQNPANPMNIPDEMKNWIAQATLNFGDNFIRMSDTMQDINCDSTEFMSIAVECTQEQAKNSYETLLDGGRIVIPMGPTFFSPCYFSVVDKFGVKWEIVGQ